MFTFVRRCRQYEVTLVELSLTTETDSGILILLVLAATRILLQSTKGKWMPPLLGVQVYGVDVHFGELRKGKNSWMKPEKFNGHGSFESFLYQFNNCTSYNRWSETDKPAHLRWAMTGAAAQLLWGTEEMSFSELMEKLRCRFSGRGMEEKFQTELRCRLRGKVSS